MDRWFRLRSTTGFVHFPATNKVKKLLANLNTQRSNFYIITFFETTPIFCNNLIPKSYIFVILTHYFYINVGSFYLFFFLTSIFQKFFKKNYYWFSDVY